MKVLSVDWDFFQNVSIDTLRKYPIGIDLPSSMTEIIWGNRYASDYDRFNSISLFRDDYEYFLKIILNQKKDIPVTIVNSHERAFDFIQRHRGNEKIELVNVDMHHDCMNGNVETDCGNWIGSLLKLDAVDKFEWIHNPISFEMYGIDSDGKDEFSKMLRSIDKGKSLEGIKDKQYDLLVFARSDTWSVPHLDSDFCLLADVIKQRFSSVTIEEDVDRPRLAYLRYMVAMQRK